MGDTKFYFKNGKTVHNLKEFYEYIKGINEEEFKHHVSPMKNDFSEWIENSIGNKELASRVKSSGNVEEMESIIALEIRQQAELADDEDDELEVSVNETSSNDSEKEDAENESENSKDALNDDESDDDEDLFKPKDSNEEPNIFDLRDEREKKTESESEIEQEEVENDVEDLISKEETQEKEHNPYANTEKKPIFKHVKKPKAPMSIHSYLMFKELLFGIMFGVILGMILMAIILSI